MSLAVSAFAYGAIVAKTSFSLGKRRSTENLSVTNCTLATNCNAFKLGTESGGDFRNITVSNCTMLARKQGRPPISGISLLSVDQASAMTRRLQPSVPGALDGPFQARLPPLPSR